MTNIFQLTSSLEDEDRFTSSLNYLIESHPEIGQQIVNYLLINSGKEKDSFEKSVDHPEFTYEDRPDFILKCSNVDIICEHKIKSPLGERQLERYLSLKQRKPSFLVLITSSECDVPTEVIKNNKYLNPMNSDIAYFKWQEMYSIIEKNNSKLAIDFCEYMKSLGMKPWSSKVIGNIFEDSSEQKIFAHAWEETRHFYKSQGAICKITSNKLGFEIAKPIDWVHLVYAYLANETLKESSTNKSTLPYLVVNIWAKKEKIPIRFSDDIQLEYSDKLIYGKITNRQSNWGKKDLTNCLQFHTELDPLLTNDMNILGTRLLGVIREVTDYCK